MAISTDVSKATLAGNGVATSFPFAFKVWETSQVKCYLKNADGDTSETTDFSVVLSESGAGGTVTYPVAGTTLLATGWYITIIRDMPFLQGTSLVNGAKFVPSVIEDAIDTATAERQQLKEAVERCVKVAPGESSDGILETIDDAKDTSTAAAIAAAASAVAAASAPPFDATLAPYNCGGAGAATRTVFDKLKDVVTPKDFGAAGDGETDDHDALQKAIDYCGVSGKDLILDGDYLCDGGLTITAPVSIRGNGNSVIRAHIDNTEPGMWIYSSDVSLKNFTVEVTLSEAVLENRGDWGSCLTIGDFATATAQTATDNINLENLRLSRSATSAGGHALVVIGRVKNLVGYNLDLSGGGGDADHYSSILMHWGFYGTVDVDGVPTAITESYHPNNISIAGLTVDNSLRAVYLSSVYNVSITGIRQSGGNNVATVAVGDEGDYYACSDDADGKVCSNIHIDDVVAWDIAGSGSVTDLLLVAGYGSSKLRTDSELTSEPAKTQNIFKNVTFNNWLVDGDADTAYLFNIRNVVGDISLHNWKGVGGYLSDETTRIASGYISNCSGNVYVEGIDVQGELTVSDCDMVIVSGGLMNAIGTEAGNNVITCTGREFISTLASEMAKGATTMTLSEGFYILSGSDHLTNGATVKKGDVILYTVYTSGITATFVSGTSFTVATDLTATFRPGCRVQADCGTDGTRYSTVSSASYSSGTGLTTVTVVNDSTVLTSNLVTAYSGRGYEVTATEFHDPTKTAISITAAPILAPAGSPVTLSKRSRLHLHNFRAESGRAGINADKATIRVRDSIFRGQGQYGFTSTDSDVVMDNVTFENGGLLRSMSGTETASTRDVLAGAGTRFVGRNLTFGKNASWVQYNFVTAATSKGGALVDCQFLGAPVTARSSLASPTYGTFTFVRCMDSTGAAVTS